jgi:hypothetical protein
MGFMKIGHFADFLATLPPPPDAFPAKMHDI